MSRSSKATVAIGRPGALPAVDINQRYSIQEASRYLRCSRAWLHRLVGKDAGDPARVEVIKDGRRRYVPGSEIARLSQPPKPARRRGGKAGGR